MKFFKKSAGSIAGIFIALFLSIGIFIISITGFILSLTPINTYTTDFNTAINSLMLPHAVQIADDLLDGLEGNPFYPSKDTFIKKYNNSNMGIRLTRNEMEFSTDLFDDSNIIYDKEFYFLYDHTMSKSISYGEYYYRDTDYKYSLRVEISVNNEYIYKDIFRYTYKFYNYIYTFKYIFIIGIILSISAVVFCTVYLCIVYGRSSSRPMKLEKLIDKVPPSVILLICLGIIIPQAFSYTDKINSIAGLNYVSDDYNYTSELIFYIIFVSFLTAFTIYNLTRLISQRAFTDRLIIVGIYKKLNTLGKGILVGCCAALTLTLFCIIAYYTHPLTAVIPVFIVLGLWIRFTYNLRRLDMTLKNYADGIWNQNPDFSPLLLENISRSMGLISISMQRTVEKSIRDERTKTELITNVSHDIKTPLTTIINYTDLLGRDNLTEEERKQYLDTLTRSSARMKKLLEDLIEASKAATGNMELNIMPCNIRTLLSQSVAEYTDVAVLRKLKIVSDTGIDDIIIQTDSSKLFRVFDNVLSNACKYSIPGSRIYIYVSRTAADVRIDFVNITENEITISAEELTERFVRGDYSRNSDGSGLGLAIAKNITELLGGKLNIIIDGDQFKLTLSFPTV